MVVKLPLDNASFGSNDCNSFLDFLFLPLSDLDNGVMSIDILLYLYFLDTKLDVEFLVYMKLPPSPVVVLYSTSTLAFNPGINEFLSNLIRTVFVSIYWYQQ